MQEEPGHDALDSERTLLAAERTYSAWIRTGLAALGGGLAIVRALVDSSDESVAVSHVIGGMLVILGVGIFIYAILSYHRSCVRLSQKGLSKNSLGAMVLITIFLLIIAGLVFWLTLQ